MQMVELLGGIAEVEARSAGETAGCEGRAACTVDWAEELDALLSPSPSSAGMILLDLSCGGRVLSVIGTFETRAR